MRAAISRILQQSSSSLSKRIRGVSMEARYMSTDSTKVGEGSEVSEPEHGSASSPPPEKLLVLGGNGFVGSHILQEALNSGLTVASLSRSGRSSLQDSWADNVTWHKGDLLAPDSLKEAMDGVTSVISCVGGFGSNAHMYKINGTANINAVKAASEEGAKRFVFISAADFGLVNFLLQGYYQGKRATERELLTSFPHGGVILRPGFIYGTRRVGSLKLPLGLIGYPLEKVLTFVQPLTQLPLIGPLFTSPVSVTAVAKVAVGAASDQAFSSGIVDVNGILQNGHEKSM